MLHKNTLFIGLLIFSLTFSTLAYADIFNSGSSGGGIFDGVRDTVRDIFEGFQGGDLGGAVIPGLTPTPTLQPGDPTPVPIGAGPPRANQLQTLKVSVEWDALSIWNEKWAPIDEDPLEAEHLALLRCPSCGGTSGPPTQPGWQVCTPQADCQVANVEHTLVGWCGQPPTKLNASRVPQEYVPSTGPNLLTLPNAVSNKYIRRDGYSYQCVRQCEACDEYGNCNPTTCAEDNYVEFQSLLYPSNAISIYVKVENIGSTRIENAVVRINTNSYSTQGEYPIAHNLDWLFDGIDYWNGSYSHGSTLANKISSLGGGDSVLIRQVNGIDLWLENTPEYGPQLVFGPFDLNSGQILDLPLQPSTAEFTEPPDVQSAFGTPTPSPSGPTPNPLTPTPTYSPPNQRCECQAVALHDCGYWCEEAIPNPTLGMCALYYGKTNPSMGDAAGIICNEECVTVPGCPPPWCFEDPPASGWVNHCNVGDMSQCPGGAKIPVFDYFGGNICGTTMEPKIKSDVAYAAGCIGYCPVQAIPPSGEGVGGIIPRDFNFICDPDDPEESERCSGSDPNVTIPPGHPLFKIYRDVSGIGGCGYNASSNNSVLGPIEIVAEWGGNGNARTARSVLLNSIPVGGRLIDSQSRPYGWPVTGEIEQNWGYTGEAQERGYYRSDPMFLYGEYRYCGAGLSQDWLHPGIDIKPRGTDASAAVVYSTHAGFVTYAGPAPPELKELGWIIQVETDVDQDNVPDYVTRYSHLSSVGMFLNDSKYKRITYNPMFFENLLSIQGIQKLPYGYGPYVARNQALGVIGDTGSPGRRHIQYEIITDRDQDLQYVDLATFSCTDNLYLEGCFTDDSRVGIFFPNNRYKPESVRGPVAINYGYIPLPTGIVPTIITPTPMP